MDKAALRERMSSLRNALGLAEVKRCGELIRENIYNSEFYKNADIIMSYVSFGNEADTLEIIKASLKIGKKTAVPVCKPGFRLLACEIKSVDELSPGTWGILEPTEPYNLVDSKAIDFIIIPGLAFDHSLNRLGYGAGYYDRFLPQLRNSAIKAGIAYYLQIVDNLPVDVHDIPMDYVITDQGILMKSII